MARRSRREAAEDDYMPEERDDEEYEEEERPKRRRRSSQDDEDDEPRRRRRPRDEDEDEEEEEKPRRRKSRSRDDEDEDDEPRARRKSPNTGGWGGYKKTKEKTSNFASKWKVSPGEEVLVKFLDDEPFGSYALHWFDELGKGVKKGWMCLESVEEACPACAVGDRPKGKALFRVVVFDPEKDPRVEVLEAGTWLADQLENLAESRNGPLSKHYWSISATGGGKKGPVNYSLSVVKEQDEDEWEDWELEPLDEDELDELEEVTFALEDVEQVPKKKEFKQLVDSLDD